jgi:hypothetical protein
LSIYLLDGYLKNFLNPNQPSFDFSSVLYDHLQCMCNFYFGSTTLAHNSTFVFVPCLFLLVL